ncbi:MAG TPA: radical SAM protein, partial [Nannocystaceae bacterium]|nr:radical SAM protein [Nannocystaceae bacterium]
MSEPVRNIRPEDRDRPRPIYVVWETTLRCDHACAHCGSRAGDARDDELSTEQLFEVADALVRLGTREVTLIGGEADLRGDVYPLVGRLARAGVRVTMQTGGRGLALDRAERLKAAGMSAIGVSIDGPALVHDRLRASLGSHLAGIRAIDAARQAGMVVTANTQVNRLTMPHLEATADELRAHGVAVWRAQLTAPMGRAADRPDWLLEPYMIPAVIDALAAIQQRSLADARDRGLPQGRAFSVRLGNNLGYYGPHEQLLRSRPGGADAYWQGCQAGKYVMGIESDGAIKGCPSLPTAPYVGGNVRDADLADLWAEDPTIGFTRERDLGELWGFCKTCYYAEVCRAGCSFTAHSTLGRRGNNPFCYHRAATLRRQGRRERLVLREAAPGDPYDFGRFEVVEEP